MADGIEVAVGYVSIVPSTRDWNREIKKLEGRSVDVGVDADTSEATTDLEKWRQREARNKVSLKVDVDSRGASNELRGLRRDFEMLGRSDALRLNLGAAAITGLPMLAAGLAEVASAIQQVAQAGLVLPGVFAGAASSVGTLTFGLTGIKDAFEALGKASDDAASSGGDVAAQARAQQSASYSLRNAIQDETQARKDVAQATKDARRELVDLNIEMRGGVISEKRAILDAQRAREELAKGGFRSASDYADAQLRVEEADQRVLEVKARNAETAERLVDSNAKGVANSDLVVSANERLTRSQQQVATAQAAMADSAPEASAAQESAALAMGKLSENGQEFVNALRGVADGPIADLRNLVQDRIFEGLAGQLQKLTGKAMPTLEKGLGGIGDAWNDTFTEIMSQFGDDENLSLLDRIFGNTADAQARMNDALDPLVEGIGTLTAAGSDSLPRLGDAFVTVSERFSDFITKADQDGRLATWIDEGITAMGNLGEIALNVGQMFTGIAEAADGDLLGNLVNWTDTWANWLNSIEGQDTLKNIFAEGKAMFEQWKPILEDLPGLFLGIHDAAQMYMGPLLNIVDSITSLLSQHPELVKLAAGAYVLFKGAQVMDAVNGLSTALTGIGTSLDDSPKKADKAAKGINAALGLIVVPAIGEMLNNEIQGFLEQNFPALAEANQTLTPDQLGKMARDWFDQNILGVENTPSANGVLPNAPGQRNGQGDPSIAGIPMPGLVDANTFQSSSAEDTGGSILPQTQALKDRYSEWGFNDIGGYREPDGFNEHSSGKAIDVMVPNWDTEGGAGAGTAVALDALRQPNTEYVIWRNEMWYPDGRREPYSGYGQTDDPTQMHMDHVHVKTFDDGGLWKNGQMGINTTGKDEFVLTPEDMEYLRSQGIDPVSIQNQALNEMPDQNLSPDQQVEQWKSEGLSEVAAGRTEGYIPAGAGFSGKTGGGIAGSFINLGAEAIKGGIDMAAQAAKMGMAAGTMGASAAAGPAGGMGIDMLAGIGKRGVDWGADMLNIGVGALSEILLPFGAPRLLSDVDPTSFMPQMGINPAATTTMEKAQQSALAAAANVNPGGQDHSGAGAAPGPVAPQLPTPPDMSALRGMAQQTAAAGAPPPQLPPVHIDSMTVADAEEVGYQISRAQNLTMMQYGGRP